MSAERCAWVTDLRSVCVEISPQMHYERDSVFPEAFTTVNAKPLLNLWRATRKAHMPIDAGHPLPVLI